MPRQTLSFAERMARDAKRDALASMSLTDRLLALILIELMDTRRRRGTAELAARLQQAGMTKAQAAAVLDTTPEVLSVTALRKKRGEDARGAPSPTREEPTR